MADIKIDITKYYFLLENVKNLIDSTKQSNIYEKEIDNIKRIENFIEKEYEIRDLMKERQLYYNTYIETKDNKPEFAAEIYKIYLQKKELLDKLKKET